MSNEVMQLGPKDAAILVRDEGHLEFLVPEDLDPENPVAKVLELVMKMMDSDHLLQYVAEYEGADYIWESDKETWH